MLHGIAGQQSVAGWQAFLAPHACMYLAVLSIKDLRVVVRSASFTRLRNDVQRRSIFTRVSVSMKIQICRIIIASSVSSIDANFSPSLNLRPTIFTVELCAGFDYAV
eukprot:SAG31_NODE_1913_length_6933_cov_9.849722_5_plen_107_part_00